MLVPVIQLSYHLFHRNHLEFKQRDLERYEKQSRFIYITWYEKNYIK